MIIFSPRGLSWGVHSYSWRTVCSHVGVYPTLWCQCNVSLQLLEETFHGGGTHTTSNLFSFYLLSTLMHLLLHWATAPALLVWVTSSWSCGNHIPGRPLGMHTDSIFSKTTSKAILICKHHLRDSSFWSLNHTSSSYQPVLPTFFQLHIGVTMPFTLADQA